MKNILTIIILLLFNPAIWATNIGGNITSDSTLTNAGNPYIVTSDLQISSGVTLTIDPGVNLYFMPNYSLKIAGELIAIGTYANPILFTTYSSGTIWGGITFYQNAVDYDTLTGTGSILKNCVLNNTGFLGTNDVYGFENRYTIKCLSATVMVDSCEIKNCDSGLLFTQGLYLYNSKLSDIANEAINNNLCSDLTIIKGNEFYNNPTIYNNPIITVGNAIIKENYFHDNNAVVILRIANYSQILDNDFVDNTNAIAIYLLGGDNHDIHNNHFKNNGTNIKIKCERHPIVNDNCFESYIDYNLYVTGYMANDIYSTFDCSNHTNHAIIDFSNNTFYMLNNSQIDSSIHDDQDDVGDVFTVNYLPLSLTGCDILTESSELNNKSGVKIFPNPTCDYVYIELQNASNIILELFDINGQILYQKENDISNFEKINISDLSKGIYLMKVISPTFLKIEKLIKY
jgi:hypothetical protein